MTVLQHYRPSASVQHAAKELIGQNIGQQLRALIILRNGSLKVMMNKKSAFLQLIGQRSPISASSPPVENLDPLIVLIESVAAGSLPWQKVGMEHLPEQIMAVEQWCRDEKIKYAALSDIVDDTATGLAHSMASMSAGKREKLSEKLFILDSALGYFTELTQFVNLLQNDMKESLKPQVMGKSQAPPKGGPPMAI